MSGKRTRKGELPESRIQEQMVRTNEPLNFRKGPGMEFDVLRILSKGELLAVNQEEQKNDFISVTDGTGEKGWVDHRYIMEV